MDLPFLQFHIPKIASHILIIGLLGPAQDFSLKISELSQSCLKSSLKPKKPFSKTCGILVF